MVRGQIVADLGAMIKSVTLVVTLTYHSRVVVVVIVGLPGVRHGLCVTLGWQWWLYSHNSVSSGGNDMAGEGGGSYITLRSQFTHNCRGGGGSYVSVPVMVLTEFHMLVVIHM